MQKVITDDLNALLDILPEHIRQPLNEQADISELVEVVMDLGRPPEARFFQREMVINSSGYYRIRPGICGFPHQQFW